MSHDAPTDAQPKGQDAGFDWDDPHHFHEGSPVDDDGHHHEEHHVSSWQLNVVILFALLFFTVLTVLVAKGEVILTTYTDFPITQLWNVIIAMAIATVKAMLVCMYFMHLRHDKPLNTMVLLFTFATMGMFLTMPAIDVGSREAIKDYGADQIIAGGSGVGMSRGLGWGEAGEDISGSIVEVSRNNKIAEVGEEKFWKTFYKKKADYKHHVHRHPADEKNYFAKWEALGSPSYKGKVAAHPPEPEMSSANRQIIRTGLTPGLFDAIAPAAHAGSDDHAHDDHDDHGDHSDHDGHDNEGDGNESDNDGEESTQDG